ncbi:MAG: transglycosylase domain-containing protein [Alphaproteobacteria bacterium]|nr:transglycosylase domain-containing protein [Alphaproteobacteria bacterium]
MRHRFKRFIFSFLALFILSGAALGLCTVLSLSPVEQSLHDVVSDVQTVRVTDRNGEPLGLTYENRWNLYDRVPLYDVPEFLKSAFLFSEDRRFFEHGGVDWPARFAAAYQNITNLRTVRGASTITEQVVRLIHPRPRSVWSRWLEGFEAQRLERSVSKADLLEFYLNQVPYGSNRRGVAQAARYYFNRDLSTLSHKEMLALVVLVRAPSAYDPFRFPGRLEKPLMRLSESLHAEGLIGDAEFMQIKDQALSIQKPALIVDARHFARYVRLNAPARPSELYRTTLDASLQAQVQEIVDQRLSSLHKKRVHNAAALIADHQTGEILAWVVGGVSLKDGETPGLEIDTVTVPRQPGSAMKPFVYTAALEKGWTGATFLNDSPLAEAVGHGLHNFRNYSNTHYGIITLREALGNSLNIPALLAIRHVGTGHYLTILQRLGFRSLSESSGIYDEGLALGNGAVTLLEMVQAYGALANKGVYKPLHILRQQDEHTPPVRVFSEEATSMIGNILSDPWARRMEFGAGSVLNLPVQTAVKTGTSTDYRDAWTMGYNDRYVVGVWMGNLDNTPMEGVTGSGGPALILRSIFSLLNKNRETEPLFLSPKLVSKTVCARPAHGDTPCPMTAEWVPAGYEMKAESQSGYSPLQAELVRPTDGLQIAYDPRIPQAHQKFRFEIRNLPAQARVEWALDDEPILTGKEPTLLWPVTRGKHVLRVSLFTAYGDVQSLEPVRFTVK